MWQGNGLGSLPARPRMVLQLGAHPPSPPANRKLGSNRKRMLETGGRKARRVYGLSALADNHKDIVLDPAQIDTVIRGLPPPPLITLPGPTASRHRSCDRCTRRRHRRTGRHRSRCPTPRGLPKPLTVDSSCTNRYCRLPTLARRGGAAGPNSFSR